MKKQIIALFITIITMALASDAQQKNVYADSNQVNANNQNLSDIKWMENAIEVTFKDHDLPAIVVGVIKNGKVEKFISKGVLNRNGARKVDENTLFQIGSLTKTFTGIIANNLISEGKLDIDASITDYLPAGLSPKAKSKLSKIKVSNLLHHQSGIPRDSKVYHRFGNDPMVCCYKEQDLLDDLEVMTLDFKPGEKSSYSNMGFAVLGYVLERASGKTYEDLVQTYVARKLQLPNTGTVLTESQKKSLATPYRKENRKYETKPFEMGKMVSGGGVYSTVADLSKLMISQMAAYRSSASSSSNPLVLTKYTKPFNENLSYGYGLFASSGGMYGHGGDLDGFGSGYTFYPKENLGLIILTSSGGRMWLPRFEALLRQKLRGREAEMPSVRKTISIPKENLERYTGAYKIAGDQIINIVQKGSRLEAYPQSSFGPIDLYFETENKLFSKTNPGFFEFEFDENGNPKKVTYNIRGNKLEAKKLD